MVEDGLILEFLHQSRMNVEICNPANLGIVNTFFFNGKDIFVKRDRVDQEPHISVILVIFFIAGEKPPSPFLAEFVVGEVYLFNWRILREYYIFFNGVDAVVRDFIVIEMEVQSHLSTFEQTPDQ